jgi:hypothetical protein
MNKITSLDVPEQMVVDIALIQRNPNNYKIHPHAQIHNLASSYERFGQRKPLVVQRKNDVLTLVAGEGGLEALRYLSRKDKKWEQAWVTLVPDEWTEEDVLGYLVADNETQRGAENDDDYLAELVERQQLSGFDIASLGFSAADYEALTATTAQNAPVVQDPEEKPDTRLDEFIFGDTRQLVLNFDVETYTDVMQRLEEIRKYRGLESNVAVFLTLLVEYEENVKIAMKALTTR